MKRFDLMFCLNTGGTDRSKQSCFPKWMKSAPAGRNPRVLHMLPPLSMRNTGFRRTLTALRQVAP